MGHRHVFRNTKSRSNQNQPDLTNMGSQLNQEAAPPLEVSHARHLQNLRLMVAELQINVNALLMENQLLENKNRTLGMENRALIQDNHRLANLVMMSGTNLQAKLKNPPSPAPEKEKNRPRAITNRELLGFGLVGQVLNSYSPRTLRSLQEEKVKPKKSVQFIHRECHDTLDNLSQIEKVHKRPNIEQNQQNDSNKKCQRKK